jgi:phosphoglycerate transport regulatory protein PgtC
MRTTVLLLFLSFASTAQELVIGTTYSLEATTHVISVWRTFPESVPTRTVNRTSTSLEQLLSASPEDSVDLILSSSPILFTHLQEKGLLAAVIAPDAPEQQWVPGQLRGHVVAFSVSGYGMLINQHYLDGQGIRAPEDWEGMADPRLRGMVILSSPSRSDTNHIMIETLLQRRGWESGWHLLLEIAGNLGTLSSRSFGVAEKVQADLAAVGPVLDSYANLLLANPDLRFHYFPDFTVSPTYIAVNAKSRNIAHAQAFIRYLLSERGQQALGEVETGKYPIIRLPVDHPLAARQHQLLSLPPIDYGLMIRRQSLVRSLFDMAISNRLAQLQEGWRSLHQAEQQVGHSLPELRRLLTDIPVSEAQSLDAAYLQSFGVRTQAYSNNNLELIDWQNYFHLRQRQLYTALGKMGVGTASTSQSGAGRR